MKEGLKISIVMPVHDGESTLEETLKSLFDQSERFDKLIIVDDASKDGSAECLKNFLGGKEYKLIQNKKQRGLAAAYNQGIRAAGGDLVVTLHQDVVLENEALEKIVVPFEDDRVMAASHIVAHPLEIWKKYNFWQKCFFARLAGKNFQGIDGKFDCFRKSALLKVGLFDEVHFRTAGEDGDMVFKMKKIGRIADTKARIIHLHKVDPNFNWRDIIKKQAQYSEAQGALLARGRIWNPHAFARSFFREILLIAFLIPYIKILSLILIVIYSFLYTKVVFFREYKDKRIWLLPFFNIFLLFVSLAYSLKGFVYGKQKI